MSNSVKFWCLHPHTGGPTLMHNESAVGLVKTY